MLREGDRVQLRDSRGEMQGKILSFRAGRRANKRMARVKWDAGKISEEAEEHLERVENEMGAFMQPELWHGGMWICEDSHGESSYFPEDIFTQQQAADQCGLKDPSDVLYEKGWWVRLSAPGYMDQTDWYGPYKTEKAARAFIYDHYDINNQGDDRKEGVVMDDDLDDEDDTMKMRSLHGLGQDSSRPAPRNKKVYNLFKTVAGQWVFRYGHVAFRFQDEELFFDTREDAVRVATRNGWVVEDNNRMRKAHPGGISG